MYSEFKLKYLRIDYKSVQTKHVLMCLNKVSVKISIQPVLIIFPSVVKKFGILEISVGISACITGKVTRLQARG